MLPLPDEANCRRTPWRLILDLPLQKVRHATVVKLSVLLPQHLRSGVSLVENLPDLGDWAAASDFANMSSNSASHVYSDYRHSFHHSFLRAEYFSWSLGTVFGNEEYLMPSVEYSSCLCRSLYQSYLKTHSQRTVFRRQWSRNGSTKQNALFTSLPPTFLK